VLFQGGYVHIFARFYYLTALLHRISFFCDATPWWCLSGSGSAEAMLVTTQAMKQQQNPKDLNLHPYISNDILVLTMGEEMSSYWHWQIHALIVTPMEKKFIWECCVSSNPSYICKMKHRKSLMY